jgi:FkbM family methyltransferase
MKFPLSFAAAVARLLPASWKNAIYHSGPLARIIRRGLNRAAPTGLTRVTVAAGELQGAEILIDMQTKKNYWLGTYEPELQAAVRHWLHPGMVVYDVGANIGYVSLLLARVVGGKGSSQKPGFSADSGGHVYAFEPLPANLERMAANFELNPWAAITCVPAAVVDHAGPVSFLAHASGAMGKAAGSAGRQHETYLAEIEVPGVTLDGFAYGPAVGVGADVVRAVREPPLPLPQAIKMDIEGGEVLALRGMARLLSEARPLLLIELHGPESARAAWDTLTAAGYRILRMQPGYPPVPSLEALDWKAYIVAEPIQT